MIEKKLDYSILVAIWKVRKTLEIDSWGFMRIHETLEMDSLKSACRQYEQPFNLLILQFPHKLPVSRTLCLHHGTVTSSFLVKPWDFQRHLSTGSKGMTLGNMVISTLWQPRSVQLQETRKCFTAGRKKWSSSDLVVYPKAFGSLGGG